MLDEKHLSRPLKICVEFDTKDGTVVAVETSLSR